MLKVLITGGAQGLGYCLAAEWLARGASVAVTSRSKEALDKQKREFCLYLDRFFATHMVDYEKDSIYKSYSELEKKMGGVDILVNNIGCSYYGPCLKLAPEKLVESFSVNVMIAYNYVQVALPSMLQKGSGHIVQVVSSAGIRGFPFRGGYCGPKFALMGLYESLRCEVKHLGISVTTVCPGAIDTDFFKNEWRFNEIELGKVDRNLVNPWKSARIIVDGVARKKERIVFPFRIRVLSLINTILPSLADRIIDKQMEKD